MKRKTKLGSMLRAARQKMGLTIAALARDVKCSGSFISRVEMGEHGYFPSDGLLDRLEDVLALDRDELYLAAGRIPPEVIEWLVAEPERMARVRKMQRAAA